MLCYFMMLIQAIILSLSIIIITYVFILSTFKLMVYSSKYMLSPQERVILMQTLDLHN